MDAYPSTAILAMAARPGYVDFAHVPPSQWKMHDRLTNWARSIFDSASQSVAPGFGLYRPDNFDREYGAKTAVPVDQEDAKKIGAAVAKLPFRQCKAIGWYYTKGCGNVSGMAREMNLSTHGLAECVIAARAALIERGT